MAADEFFATREAEGVLVVTFRHGHILDAVTIERMSARLKELVDRKAHARFVLDFAQVTYLSSSALGMLIGLQRRAVQAGGRLKLCGIRSDIMEVFRITKLDTVFDIYKDTPAALEAHRKEP